MPLQPPLNPVTNRSHRERMVVYGGPGCGKTSSWLSIAGWSARTGSSSKFYVIDTDATVETMLMDQYKDLTNIEVRTVFDWPDIRDAGREFMKLANRGDWIVIDMAGVPWKAVQNYFSETVHGVDDAADYALKLKQMWEGSGKKGKEEKEIDGWDWGYVNRLYDSFIKPIMFKSQAHVFCVCESAEVKEALEGDKEKFRTYSKVGAKPVGQKSLDYQVSTVLYLQKRATGRFITTVKDRERVELDNESFDNMVSTYLVPVANWSLR